MNIHSIWQEHADFVLKICLRHVNNMAEAEDLRQEVFLKIWNSKKEFKKQSSIKTWIYSIVRNCCIDFFRVAGRHRNMVYQYFREEKLCLRDSHSPLWKVSRISEMPCPISQLFVELHFGEGWSKEEIAQVFGFSPDHVNKRVQTGVQHLQKILHY
ncbi:MAG: RNA polymerase sigma factor [Fibromonadales bacterium]|nr:RNA polymerase sigma factor [Fibromonadales bacterium]